MANCVELAKIWVAQDCGATEIIRQMIVQEMRVLFEQVSGSFFFSSSPLVFFS